MDQVQLINAVVDWERRLGIEAETRSGRATAFSLTALLAKPGRSQGRSFFARILEANRDRESQYSGQPYNQRREDQPN